MTNKLTEKELAEISERAKNATAGPWKLSITDDDFALHLAENEVIHFDYGSFLQAMDNAEFLSFAREDILKLLTEVERLKAIIDKERESTQRQILDETRKVREELERERRKRELKNFDWYVGF